jgi:hypothetical protein
MVKSLVIYTVICDYCGKDLCAEMKYCGWNTDPVTKVPDRGFGRNFSFVFSSEINDWMGDSAERKKVYQERYRRMKGL